MAILTDNLGQNLVDLSAFPLTDTDFDGVILPPPTPNMLVRSPDNPRYLMRPDGTVLYFAGSHVWNNLQDWGPSLTPAFDFFGYVNWMVSLNQNFMRMWADEQPSGAPWTPVWFFDPMPFARPGPGTAADGLPKFDLTSFNQAYFDRLSQRVAYAESKGVYVCVMLFNGWSLWDKGVGGFNPFITHPMRNVNNIQGINGDPRGLGNGRDLNSLTNIPAACLTAQKLYVQKVIDTVNGYSNVLYEISNEPDGPNGVIEGSRDWQYAIINYIQSYESGLTNQNPIMMTGSVVAPGYTIFEDADLFAAGNHAAVVGPADSSMWVGSNADNSGAKVVVIDTDHIRPDASTIDVWCWKNFLRGYNTIHMDDLSDGVPFQTGTLGGGIPAYNVPLRRAMQQTLRYAARCNLAFTVPNDALAATGFCIAKPGTQYLLLAPSGGTVNVNLSAGVGKQFLREWMRVSDGTVSLGANVAGGSSAQPITSPFGPSAAAVLFLNDAAVGIIDTTSALTSSNNPSTIGQLVTLTAIVTPVSGVVVPTGTATFKDLVTIIAVVALDGAGHAQFPTSVLTVGLHNLTVVYSGDGNFNPSTSGILIQQVLPPVTPPGGGTHYVSFQM